jgi:putative phosphoribosyl transferase
MALFKDREDAGKQLARRIAGEQFACTKEAVVLGIPRGGVAVGLPVAELLRCPLYPITLRKLPTPTNDQVGFGAVTLEKSVILNEDVLAGSDLSSGDIQRIVDEVYKEVLRRNRRYLGRRRFPDLKGRNVIIVDDGLATGYTMLAAVRYAREKQAACVMAAVPVAHEEAYARIEKETDELVCLHVDHGYFFAVASFYDAFPDMSDEEVMGLLKRQEYAHTS